MPGIINGIGEHSNIREDLQNCSKHHYLRIKFYETRIAPNHEKCSSKT